MLFESKTLVRIIFADDESFTSAYLTSTTSFDAIKFQRFSGVPEVPGILGVSDIIDM